MHTLLFIWAYIAFAFVVPALVTAVTSAIILLTACAIQVLAKLVSGFQPSFMEAFKAIGLSFFFLFLALLFFASAFFSSAQAGALPWVGRASARAAAHGAGCPAMHP